MKRIVWSYTARADLRAIHDFIARDSRLYARRMVDRIRKSVERLKHHPLSGGMVSEWEREDLREILVGNYRVIYRPEAASVQILTVIHAARQLPSPNSLD